MRKFSSLRVQPVTEPFHLRFGCLAPWQTQDVGLRRGQVLLDGEWQDDLPGTQIELARGAAGDDVFDGLAPDEGFGLMFCSAR
jgi:hypothetical protein